MFNFKEHYNIDDLIEIVSILRSENGCPWDKVQTHESIKPSLIEEVYEVFEAIDLKDKELLKEELGDVLLQVVFHAQMETEQKHFNFDDVCHDICYKLIIRHPHVFGEITVSNCDEVLTNWEQIKQQTKGQTTFTETLESVPKTFPALMKAQKINKRAAKSGLDTENLNTAIAALKSKISNLEKAASENNKELLYSELGDVLFACSDVARKADLDAEMALTDCTEKFIKQFSETEKLIRLNEMDMKSLSIDELKKYWKQAEAQTKQENI